MANHKWKRPSGQRHGCVMCKPHKTGWGPLRDRYLARDLRRMLADPRVLSLRQLRPGRLHDEPDW